MWHLVDAEYEMVHAEWTPLFIRGSSPANWEGNIPSNEDVIAALTEQTTRLTKVLVEKLDKPLQNPIDLGDHNLETIGSLILFAIWHEGIHIGVIDGLNRVIEK